MPLIIPLIAGLGARAIAGSLLARAGVSAGAQFAGRMAAGRMAFSAADKVMSSGDNQQPSSPGRGMVDNPNWVGRRPSPVLDKNVQAMIGDQ